MASCTTGQKLFGIKTFYFFDGCRVFVEGEYRRKFSVRVAPSGDTVYWIIKQSEETGIVWDKRKKGCKQFVLHFHDVRDL
jgi:hypothetical protein